MPTHGVHRSELPRSAPPIPEPDKSNGNRDVSQSTEPIQLLCFLTAFSEVETLTPGGHAVEPEGCSRPELQWTV